MNVDRRFQIFEALFKGLTLPLALAPNSIAIKLGENLALLVGRLWRGRMHFAVDNLTKAVANGSVTIDQPAKKVVETSFKNLGRSFIEMIKIYHGRGGAIWENVRLEGEEHFKRAKSKGKGVILITGHCGNWELLSLVVAVSLGKCHVVARALNNKVMNQILENIRVLNGNEVVYKQGAVRKMLSTLRQGETVGILIDQAVLKDEALLTSFLGRPALTSKLPALLARKTKSPVIPIFCHRNANGGHTIITHPEIKPSLKTDQAEALQEDTQNFTRYVENYIAEHPDQWLWGHRRWKRAPEKFPEEDSD